MGSHIVDVGAAGLLERDDELAALDVALAAARAERSGSVVLVVGEAGIGKSSLVGAWIGELAGQDVIRLVGWCDDFLTSRPLGPFHDIARAVDGPFGEAVAAADTGAVLEEVLALVANPLRPTVVVLEDVHWADEATLDVVRYLGRRIGDLPAVLVLTYRDTEVGADHPLAGVLGVLATGPIVRLSPRPLSGEAIARVLGADGPAPTEVAKITGGNPFFVSEVARSTDTEVPTTVAAAVLARTGVLSRDEQEALAVLSVVPGTVDTVLASAVVGDLARLASAERHGVLVTAHDGVRFRHELARRAVEGSLTPIERTIAHRRVLDCMLQGAHDDGAALLHHAVGAGAADVVAAYGPGAALEAFRAGANRQAVALGEQVLALSDQLTDEQRADVLQHHARALHNLHRVTDAVAAAGRAVRLRETLGDPTALARALLVASRTSYLANDPASARATMDRAAATAAGVDDDVLAAEVLVERAQLLVLTDDGSGRADAVDAALPAAEGVGRPDLIVLARHHRGLVRTSQGERDAGLADLREGVRVGLGSGVLEPTARTWASLVEELLRAGRWDEAAEEMDAATAFYEDHDFVSHRFDTASQRGLLLLWQGHWQDAEALLRDLHASVVGTGVLEVLPLNGLARLATWRGDHDAEQLVDRAWQVALASGAAQHLTTVGGARLEFAWLHGRDDLVDETLDAAVIDHAPARHLGMLLRMVQISGMRPDLEVEPDRFPEPYRSGLAGDWRRAADEWEALGARFPRSLELADSGESDAMLEALATLDELGAVAVASWLRGRLRALGVTSIPRGPQRSTRGNPAGLTDRQLEVLELVSEGLTNAAIADRLTLSVRTVDHHVSAILTKLGVSNRQDAVAASGLSTD